MTPFPHATAHVNDCLAWAKRIGLEPLDADGLMLYTLQRALDNRIWLRLHCDHDLSAKQIATYQTLCTRRTQGEPLAYITGERGFYGLVLDIDSRVLDPRPDTETLVDWALDVLHPVPHPRVVDLGTGSGAIALAIQHTRRDAYVLAVDASPDALVVAQANAQKLQLQVAFAQGSWLSPLPSSSGWDLIVSNPPYIAENDPHMAALHHEPRHALVAGSDGLNDIRHIIHHSPDHLRSGGWLMLEHGHDQAASVQDLMRSRGFKSVQSRNDLAGIARCTGGIWNDKPNTG